MPDDTMTCARAESLVPDYLDGTLAAADRAALDAHLERCDACASLVADLAAIASEARALPALAPSRDLWSGIEARIAAPVVELDTRRITRVSARATWWRGAAAAAVLVAVTAGITWRVAVERTPTTTTPVATVTPAPSGDTMMVARDTGTRTDTGSVAPTSLALASGTGKRATTGTAVRRPAAPTVALPAAAAAYDREIAGMRTLLRERRSQLDTGTVRVLERNLNLIDQAITESRAALAKDPASGLLAEQLTRAMRRKLELLRTAADIPARIS